MCYVDLDNLIAHSRYTLDYLMADYRSYTGYYADTPCSYATNALPYSWMT